MAIGVEKHQSAEAGRADRIALGDGFRRIADRVERVGHAPDLLGQAGHLGDAAGVVGHRAEGVERDDHAGEPEHCGDGDRGAEKPGELARRDNAANDDERRQGGRFQRNGEALDDIGAMTGHGRLGDRDDRALCRCRCNIR